METRILGYHGTDLTIGLSSYGLTVKMAYREEKVRGKWWVGTAMRLGVLWLQKC